MSVGREDGWVPLNYRPFNLNKPVKAVGKIYHDETSA